VLDQFGMLDPELRYCMDLDYWLRIRDQIRWHYLPQPLAVMRQHAGSKTGSQLIAAWKETAEMAKRHGCGASYAKLYRRMRWGGAWWFAVKRRVFGGG